MAKLASNSQNMQNTQNKIQNNTQNIQNSQSKQDIQLPSPYYNENLTQNGNFSNVSFNTLLTFITFNLILLL